MPQKPSTRSQQDLLYLKDLFEQAVKCPFDERQEMLTRLRAENASIADQLEELLRLDNEQTVSQAGADGASGHHVSTREDTETHRLEHIQGYEILKELGRGGMGVVYKARQLNSNRIVALKMIKVGKWATHAEIERFRNEINSVAQLEHHGVIPVYEIGESEGEHYFTMQFVDEGTLDQYLNSDKFNLQDALNKFAQICDAVAYCHERGIVHRDLKPSNIILDKGGMPKVGDFGLAKHLYADAKLTSTGELLGTPGYMAPEQAIHAPGIKVDARADVYSLGAILYKILTGKLPIAVHDADLITVVDRIASNDVLSPRSADRSIPRDIESVCMRCLETKPAARYQTARPLFEDVRSFLEGESVSAVPVTAHRRLYRWARRQPGLAVTIAIIIVFYSYHVICVYGLKVYDLSRHEDLKFHRTSSVVALTWAAGATWFQRQLNQSPTAIKPVLGWVFVEVSLLTLLLLQSKASTDSPLCSIYLIVIAASVLRLQPMIVLFVTGLSLAGYALLHVSSRMSGMDVSLFSAMPVALSMGGIGLIQYFALRRSKSVLERHDQTREQFRR